MTGTVTRWPSAPSPPPTAGLTRRLVAHRSLSYTGSHSTINAVTAGRRSRVDGLASRQWYRRWWIVVFIPGIVVLALAAANLAASGQEAQLTAVGTSEPSTTVPPSEAGPPSPSPSLSPVAVTSTPSPTKRAGGSSTGSGSITGNHTRYPHLDITFTGSWSGGPFGIQRVKVHLVVTDATNFQRTTVIVHWRANGVDAATEQRAFNGAGTFDTTFEHVFEGCGIKPSARLEIEATPSASFAGPLPVELPMWLCAATPTP
jgi:hypothetical protein